MKLSAFLTMLDYKFWNIYVCSYNPNESPLIVVYVGLFDFEKKVFENDESGGDTMLRPWMTETNLPISSTEALVKCKK